MIYCPKCGTANREGSNFCNSCGQRLAKGEGKQCPMCGQLNPLEAETCQHCEARLTPLRRPETGPTAESEPEEEADLFAPENWAKEEPEEMAEQAEASTEAPDEEVLDWLQRLRQSASGSDRESEPPAISQEGSEGPLVPDWLEKEDDREPAAEQEPLAQERDLSPLPGWLADMVASDESQEPEEVEEGPEDSVVPDWLREIVAGEQGPALASADQGEALLEDEELDLIPSQQEAEADLADWEEAAEVESTGGLLGRVSDDDAPDWLLAEGDEEDESLPLVPEAWEPALLEEGGEEGEIAGPGDLASLEWHDEEGEALLDAEPAEMGEEPADLLAEGEASEEVPDWLKDLAGGGTIEPPADEPLESFDEADVLAQERGAQERGGLAERAGLEAAIPEQEEGLSEADIPDWLRDLAPVGAPGAEEGEEGLAEAQIPDWLRELEPAQAAPPEPEERAEEGRGILAGISGILPVESVWKAPQRAQATPTAPPLTSGEEAAEIFADILGGQPEARSTLTVMRDGFLSKTGARLAVYALLALAVILPLFVGVGWLGESIQVPQPAWGTWEAVDAVASGSTVLMAFDYDPATAAELDLQAVAMLRHLADKGVRVVALSSVPQGPALAQHAWEWATGGLGLQYGHDFVNLGYLTGQESGLRLLTRGFAPAFTRDYLQRPLAESPLLSEVEGIRDISLVVLLSADQMSVRRWLEQVQSAFPLIKVVAGVSALAGPAVTPYYHSGQLNGVIVGMPGAAQYEVAMNRPATAVSNLGSQSLGHLAIILVILLGNLAALGNWIRQRK